MPPPTFTARRRRGPLAPLLRSQAPMPPAPPPRPPAPGTAAARLPQRPPPWDALLACVAGYAADAVGRLQSLFPLLRPLKPALVCAAGAIVLYLAQQGGLRRFDALRSRTTTAVLLLLGWAALSVPAALNQGAAFFFLTGFLSRPCCCTCWSPARCAWSATSNGWRSCTSAPRSCTRPSSCCAST